MRTSKWVHLRTQETQRDLQNLRVKKERISQRG